MKPRVVRPVVRLVLMSLVVIGSYSIPPQQMVVTCGRPAAVGVLASPDSSADGTGLLRLIRTQERLGAVVGMAVISIGGDSLVFAHNALSPLIPASNQKLLVTASSWAVWDDSLVRDLRRSIAPRPAKGRVQTASRTARRGGKRTPVPAAPRVDTTPIWNREQDPLTGLPGWDLLCRIHKWSDNFVANRLAECLARRKSDTLQAIVRAFLDREGAWSGGLNVVDGSGRSPRNRAAALSIAHALRLMFRADRRDAYTRSLARPGLDGTLRRHSFNLWDKVAAKTGSISGVYSLSGYLYGESDTLAFSILLNQYYSKSGAFSFFRSALRQLGRQVGAIERVRVEPRRRTARQRRRRV